MRRPVGDTINTAFNEATSGHLYGHPSGHAGIDYLSGVNTTVRAMYGGVVVRMVYNWVGGKKEEEGLANLVTIRSCTDPATATGFEHTYAHLQ